MAAGQKAEIEESDIEGHDGTLETALVAWTGKRGPVVYNKWQSAYFRLIREFGFADEKAPQGEDPTARQKRMLVYYDEMQTDMFGSDHRVQATKRQRSSGAQNQQDGGGSALALQVAVRPEDQPERHEIYTPKQLDLESEGQPEEESPEWLLALPEAERVWDKWMAGDSDEESEGRENRHAEMTAQLMQIQGATGPAAVFAIEVDQLIPHYQQLYGEFKEQHSEDKRTMQEYALQHLLQFDGAGLPNDYELKRHVFALGKLAGRTGQQSRALCKVLCARSQATTPIDVDVGG